MNELCAVRVHAKDVECLGRLRRCEIEVCRDGDWIWLRAPNASDELQRKIRALPGLRYTVLSGRQLVPSGALVPQGYLPQGPWLKLHDLLTVRVRPAALGGTADQRVGLRMNRGGAPRDCNVLLTTIELLEPYVRSAPRVRLDCWSLAVAGDGQAVVRGTPLPPIAGNPFVETEGVALPAGWQLQPAIETGVVRQVLELQQNDLALLHEGGFYDLLRADDFVRATRSAVRLTREAMDDV